ncbi:MAG: DUF6057 family protein [Bacteroidales bacterium]|jgi:hypothetical protein
MNQSKTNNNPLFSWIPYLVFFIGSFIYFGFFADYILFYQEKSSLFIFSSDFLLENLHQPGGLLIWLGKFFSTFYYYPLAGAIILSSLLTMIVILASKIILILKGNSFRVIPFIIGVSLFYLQTEYHFLLFNSLGLLLQLAIFWFIIRYLSFFKGWAAVIIVPFWFYATGGFALIFLLLMTLYFAFDKENKGWIRLIALWSLSFITFYISKEYLFSQSGKSLLTFPFIDHGTGSQRILFISISGIISILPVISKIRFRLPDKLRISDFTWSTIISIILVIIVVIIGIRRFDNKTKQYFHVENLFFHNKFSEVIEFNSSNPPTNSLTIFLNNIALCESDKLDDLLFHFLQSPDGKTLFLKWEMVDEVLNRGGYFYYEIGMINEAHRWAFENMVMKGHSPEGLKMLIKTELINANYEVASRYINILKKTLFYKNEAKAFEKLLFNDAAVNSDNELGEKRQNKVENDFFSITDNPYINIEMILASDSLNRKAFEYKMAFMLLKKNYAGIAHELPSFEKFGYTRLPVHIEEAALALAVSNKGKIPDMGNIQISKNTELRWNQFLNVLRQYNNDLKSAEPVLRRRFGDTFWYYVFYK